MASLPVPVPNRHELPRMNGKIDTLQDGEAYASHLLGLDEIPDPNDRLYGSGH
jgi:hypothetical protein